MDQLYLEVEVKATDGALEIWMNIDSFIVLYIYRYLDQASQRINLNFVHVGTTESTVKDKLRLRSHPDWVDLAQKALDATTKLDSAITDLRLPVFVSDEQTYIAGLCAVCRELVKQQPCTEEHKLLGFKAGCLLAPAEMSVWTKFVEVDIATATKLFLFNEADEKNRGVDELWKQLLRFEGQMQQPVRMHNIYKLAREQARASKMPADDVSRVPKEQLSIKHRFVEGVDYTLADLMLFPYCCLLRLRLPWPQERFPLVSAWFNEVTALRPRCVDVFEDMLNYNSEEWQSLQLPSHLSAEALTMEGRFDYVPMRPKSRARIFTEQREVDECLRKLRTLNIAFQSSPSSLECIGNVNWNELEPDHDKTSSLPQERLLRKRQQLENMANAVGAMALPGERIVDFCSGTGHLGILLALQLPQNTIILMENKPFSLRQARQRVAHLRLTNVRFYQCNIDYFVGPFDLGVALHACGTATDIVLQQCHRARAKFVCCPCCYGALRPMPHITYPLSDRLRSVLSEREFMYVAHCADQAHPPDTINCSADTLLQGQLCMDIVDTDRKLAAEESGYRVALTRLHPEECTPKNRLLVGTRPRS